jgi:hypothetical protein
VTITNKTVQDARENIHENVDLLQEPKGKFQDSIAKGKNIRLPSGQILSPEAQIMFDSSIVAKKLGAPASEEIHVKNLAFHYYWENRLGAGGSMYAKAKSRGYVNATLDDVEPMAVEIVKENPNEIRLGDLILMKIPVERWMQDEKAKMELALALQRRNKRYFAKPPSTDVNSDETAQVEELKDQQAGDGKYMRHYQPTEAELTAKMGADKLAGRE